MAIAFRGQFYFAAEGQSNFIRVIRRHHRPLSYFLAFLIENNSQYGQCHEGQGRIRSQDYRFLIVLWTAGL